MAKEIDMIDQRIYASSVFVVTDAGDVLLIHHLHHGMWLPPGGRHEPNETPLEAAVRELREETGITHAVFPRMNAPEGTPLGFLGYEEHPGKGGTHLNFCFIAHVPSPVPIHNQGPEEYSEYDWFTRTEQGWRGIRTGKIAEPMPPNVRDVLHYIHTHPSG